MGASSWEYVVPYQNDLGAALAALRLQVFELGDYLKPSFYGANGGHLGVPDPSSLDDLHQEPYWEFMGTSGTHSIIDVFAVAPIESGPGEFGTIRPLSEGECVDLFGVAQPGRSEYATVAGSKRLYDFITGGRWTGRAAVLSKDGAPNEIVFLGIFGRLTATACLVLVDHRGPR
jgi:hypothetical protein